jgi:protein TonB
MNAVVYPTDFGLIRPPGRRRMSRQAAAAIGFSLAVHAALFGYLATQKFKELKIYGEPEPPVLVTTERLPKEEPPKPVEHRTAAPPPIAVHAPDRDIPTLPNVDPLPVVQAPPQPAEPEVIPTLPEKPVQLADVRPAPPKERVIRNPTWLRRPSGDELGRLYPHRAADLGKSGAATLMCSVTATGSVRDCAVVDESPKGLGFGEAAMASARLFKLNPRTVDGEAVEGAKVRIPLVFSLAD